MALEPTSQAFLGWVSKMVHTHRTRLLRVARKEGLGAEDALDCVQDAFAAFLLMPQARIIVEIESDSAKLLTVVVRNAARNRRRRHHLSRPHSAAPEVLDALPAGDLSVEELIAQADDHIRLVGCFNRLSAVQRSVLRLRMLDEVPGENVATTLGLSRANVATLLHRAKQQLLECLTAVDTSFVGASKDR